MQWCTKGIGVLLVGAWLGIGSLQVARSEESGGDAPHGKKLSCYLGLFKKSKKISGRAARVVDGDTISLEVQPGSYYSIRLLTIDTAELHYQGKSQGRWAELARDALVEQLPVGAAIEVETEEEPCDKYGRILGHVWYQGVNLNKKMLEQGLAINYCIYPNAKYCEEYSKVVQKVQAQKRGVFSDPEFVEPFVWRRQVSGSPFDRWVGNQKTKLVVAPEEYKSVPTWARIFFASSENLPAPYHLAEKK